MGNKYDFRMVDMSKQCIDCKRPLKLNLLDKHPDAKRCYKCHNKYKNKSKHKKEINQSIKKRNND